MGKILNGYILPHPPIIVQGIGRGREQQAGSTIEAVKRAAREIGKDKPATIILSTPHAPCFRDYVYISDTETLAGDFADFGCPDLKFSFQNNTDLAARIAEKASLSGIGAGGLSEQQKRQYGISGRLDHGALVPLCFIEKELKEFRLVCISTPFLPFREIFEFGKCIREAVEESDEKAVYIASGDLSHRLTEDAPAGYHPKGREYDEALVEKVRRADIAGLLETDLRFLEQAGECGARSAVMMFGALDGMKLTPEIYSYEGPFGVGYLIAKVGAENKAEADDKACERNKESDYVRLARETLETYVREGRKISVPQWIPADFDTRRAGVFVSLKKGGMLRGCIGTIEPVRANIAEEIIFNAISAGTRDPRFPEVRENELKDLVYSVDLLGAPEKIDSIDQLDVKRYGVIVTSGFRRGLLLPDLEGVGTPQQQVEIAMQKAGIRRTEPFEMERFEVIRHH